MTFFKIDQLMNLYDGYLKSFSVNNEHYILVCEGGKSFIYLDRCPHMNKPLGNNCLHANTIRCPWHGAEYDVTTGVSTNIKDGRLQLRQIPVAYEDTFIGLYLD